MTRVCKTQFHLSSSMEWPGVNQSASATHQLYQHFVFLVSSAAYHSIDKQCKTPPNYGITGLLVKDLIWFQLWSVWLYHSRAFKGVVSYSWPEITKQFFKPIQGFQGSVGTMYNIFHVRVSPLFTQNCYNIFHVRVSSLFTQNCYVQYLLDTWEYSLCTMLVSPRLSFDVLYIATLFVSMV